MEKIKMMKKLLLILLFFPVIFTSCKKEEIELSIDQGPNTTMDGQITWNSHLKLTLEKNF